MNYTILSANYANPEHTAAEIKTVESAAVMISERDRPEAWAEFKEWEKTNSVAVYIEPIVEVKPTLDDIVAILTPEQKASLNARINK